jgi:peptidoglycan/xylan/chitin deacetylase (PgdA/CDA1 family)
MNRGFDIHNGFNIKRSLIQSAIGKIGKFFPSSFGPTSRFINSNGLLLVLCYHNIVSEINPGDICGNQSFLNLPIDIFKKQIKWIHQNFKVIKLDDIISGQPISGNSALITFDDGFKSVLTNAFPVLNLYKIPATLFLTGGHIQENRIPWTTQLHYLLNNYLLELSLCKYKSYCKHKKLLRLFNKIKLRFRQLRPSEIFSSLSFLEKSIGISVPSNVISEQFLSSNDIKKLESFGWTIGNHTYNHPNLVHLTSNEIREEITTTQEALSRFKSYRKVLALPFGDQSSYSSRIVDIARQVGISHVFTTICQFNAFHNPSNILHRIAPETLSFDYFKFLVQGKKTRIQQILKKLYNSKQFEA